MTAVVWWHEKKIKFLLISVSGEKIIDIFLYNQKMWMQSIYIKLILMKLVFLPSKVNQKNQIGLYLQYAYSNPKTHI